LYWSNNSVYFDLSAFSSSSSCESFSWVLIAVSLLFESFDIPEAIGENMFRSAYASNLVRLTSNSDLNLSLSIAQACQRFRIADY